MLIVQKYGGSSLKNPERLRHVARMCKERSAGGAELVVVVSAMGGTTDALTGRAHEMNTAPSARELDALVTTGEQQSAALLVMTMEEMGLPAVSLTGWQAGILTDAKYGDGDIRLISPGRIRAELSRGRVPVVTGFQGVCAAGDVTSLGRGGSDTTAVALAAALEADECEIYTDVDGIYTADPRLLPQAKLLTVIDTRDMLALAKAGAKVLHAKSVELALAGNVTIRLLSSFHVCDGSEVRLLPDAARPRFAGLTGNVESGRVTLAGKGADASALSEAVLLLSAAGIRVRDSSFAESAMSLYVSPEDQPAAMALVHDGMVLPQFG
ncbi:MAG: aspartate kinase [Oscillospiraceae bacterium]|nr:aspartate kinase [Oscillospiraceae bacterium]